ncbi:hypothetical protein L195_g014853 [Trifolium pratense]|uniref:Reverse transcriptase zinc-binding domain-containing protein n=1 Tax=Trifolium pratense TaxID=57577 RepID=A0A2K3PS23_TRIPR|nr:hypothetical protein L195_g014853 [Trifolium pratense]
MFSLGWGLDGAAWVWRRQLRAWEEELLRECQSLLTNNRHNLHIGGSSGASHLAPTGFLEAHFCVSGCGDVETTHHLFISCNTFGSIWALVCTWIDISPTGSTSTWDHFVQFTSSAGSTRARRSFLQLIWLVSVWVVWTERNHRLFRGSTSTLSKMLDKIKLL